MRSRPASGVLKIEEEPREPWVGGLDWEVMAAWLWAWCCRARMIFGSVGATSCFGIDRVSDRVWRRWRMHWRQIRREEGGGLRKEKAAEDAAMVDAAMVDAVVYHLIQPRKLQKKKVVFKAG